MIFFVLNISSSDLTWRDIQYLIVYTSDTTKLKGGEWTTNGAGLNVILNLDLELLMQRPW